MYMPVKHTHTHTHTHTLALRIRSSKGEINTFESVSVDGIQGVMCQCVSHRPKEEDVEAMKGKWSSRSRVWKELTGTSLLIQCLIQSQHVMSMISTLHSL